MKPTGFTANYMFILSWDSLIHLQSHLRLSCAGNYKEENTEKIANRVYANVHSEDLNKTISLPRKQAVKGLQLLMGKFLKRIYT